MGVIVQDQKSQLTQYLLGQLNEADEEIVELRLLSDPAFSAEFDIVVDEIAIRYASGGYEGKEKDQVERYFLRAPERQDKVKVMCELLHHSATNRGQKRVTSEPVPAIAGDLGLLARARRFWRTQPLMPRFAVTLATVVIVVGLIFLLRPERQTIPSYVALTLTATDSERGQPEDEARPVKLPSGTEELRLQLLLPPQQSQPKTYRAEVIPSATSAPATVVSHDAESVVVVVPAASLRRDRYGVRLFAVYAEGREERIPGTYVFRVVE